MGRTRRKKIEGNLDFTAIIKQHIRHLPPELAREEELDKLFRAAVDYTNRTPEQREINRQEKAKWLTLLDAEAGKLNDEIYTDMDPAISAVWNRRNLGLYRLLAEKTKWKGAKAMEGVYKEGWDCAEVRETNFLQKLAPDDKKRYPENKLADRTRKEGQDISRMPDHVKTPGAAEETWNSWEKKVLGGPSKDFVVEFEQEEVRVWPTSVQVGVAMVRKRGVIK